MAEIPKMERKFHLMHVLVEDGQILKEVVEDRKAYFHGAEFRLGIFVILSETVAKFREFAELGDELVMTLRNESWMIKRIE